VNRSLKNAILILMLALVPLRALAAVTVGDCAVAQYGTAASETMDHAAPHEHGGAPHSQGDAKHDHEHCASASFVASAELLPLPTQAASDCVVQRERFAAGFVPDHLDPPPLAL